jgi:hypothetical protein
LLATEPDSSEKEAEAGVLLRTLQVIQPLARRLSMLGGANDGVLTMQRFGGER